MTINDQVAKITRETIVPSLFDQVSINSPFLLMTLKGAKKWLSGKSDELPIKTAKSSQGGTFGIGAKLPSNRTTNRDCMVFNIKGIEKPIVIDDIEHLLNQGAEQVLDAVVTESDSMKVDLLDDLADQIYGGTGSGDDWTGFQVAADDATNYGTYGSLSRISIPALNGYYAASVGALTLAVMATAADATSKGGSHTRFTYTTKSLWSSYEALSTPTVNANYTAQGAPMMTDSGVVSNPIALNGAQGFQFLSYRGRPVVSDEKCQSGRMYLVNDQDLGKRLAFGAVMADMSKVGPEYSTVNFQNTDGKAEGTFGARKAPLGFNFRDLMNPVDQLSKVGYIMFLGEFEAAQPRLQGQLRDLT